MSTLPHPNQPRVNDYHTLGDCFPEEVFYMDQKQQTPASQHKKQTLREGTYEISSPFNDVNNNGYNANFFMTTNEMGTIPAHYLTSMPAFPNNSSSTINVSSKQLYGSGPRTPLLVATLRAPPSDFAESTNLDMSNRSQPVAAVHKASANRILTLNQYGGGGGEEMRSTANPTFYVATEAYQTLDPLTLPKGPPPPRDGAGRRYRTDSCDPKVTFNLDVLPMGNKDAEGEEEEVEMEDAEGSVSTGRITRPTELVDQSIKERSTPGSGELTRRDLGFMYAKASAHHSSFV